MRVLDEEVESLVMEMLDALITGMCQEFPSQIVPATDLALSMIQNWVRTETPMATTTLACAMVLRESISHALTSMNAALDAHSFSREVQ